MTISMLKPESGRLPAYDRFYRSYSMLISTNLVTHHLVQGASELELTNLLQETVTASEGDYRRAEVLYASMGLTLEAVQLGEERGLDLADVSLLLAVGDMTAKETILAFQNFNEFVLLFALFEDAVKELLATPGGTVPATLKEPEVMARLLGHLQAARKFDRFRTQLLERTICENYEDAKLIWDYFVAIRHLYVHSGGRPTAKWLGDYKNVREFLLLRLRSADIAKIHVRDVIEGIAPEERRLLVLCDSFVNFFRNFVVAVMEAVYVSTLPRVA